MSGAVTGAIGLGLSVVSTGFSFIQSAQARERSNDAQLEGERKMAEARGRTDINFYENLAVQQETYNRAYREQQTAAAANLQAMQEQGVRGVAGVGQLQQATQDAMSSVRAAQEKELVDRERLIAQEDSRLRDINIQLDLGEVEGAQLAAASEANAANYAMQQGIQGLTDIGVGVAESQTLLGGPREGMTAEAKKQLDAQKSTKKKIPKIGAKNIQVVKEQPPAGLTSNTGANINEKLNVADIDITAKTGKGKGIGQVFTRPNDSYEFKKLADGTFLTRKKGQGKFKPAGGGLEDIEAAFKQQFGQ